MYDIVIIGGGPAGMTAALYARRNGKTALVLEKNGFGGQITYSPRVENWPGTIKMSGNEFADRLLEQITAQGAETEIGEAVGIKDMGETKRVVTDDGEEYDAKAVVLAVGVKHRMLGLPGEEELVGNGVSFCAVCDGDFYRGQTVAVAGGGNSALQEAILLADGCKEVVMVQDMDFFTGEQKLQDALFSRKNVRAMTGMAITGLLKDENGLRGLSVRRKADGEESELPCSGLFVAIGLVPENGAFADIVKLNKYGYADSGEDCLTATPGVFCAGDCRSKGVRQLTTAVSDGAAAALAACDFINKRA